MCRCVAFIAFVNFCLWPENTLDALMDGYIVLFQSIHRFRWTLFLFVCSFSSAISYRTTMCVLPAIRLNVFTTEQNVLLFFGFSVALNVHVLSNKRTGTSIYKYECMCISTMHTYRRTHSHYFCRYNGKQCQRESWNFHVGTKEKRTNENSLETFI